MAMRAIDLLMDGKRRTDVGRAAAACVRERFCTERIVPQYEHCYQHALS